MASTFLTRSISSGGSDLTKFTYSVWIKRSAISGSYQRIFSNDTTDTKDMYIRWQNTETFHGFHRTDYSTTAFSFATNAVYRDVNGWYHLVVKYDSTQSTQSDRLKVYVNGEEPSMASITYPSQNQVVNFMNTGEAQDIGYYRTAPGEYFDGLMSHIHFTAGYAYDASSFGETDATTGEWKIKTSPSVTYGSLGYFILKDDNSVTDQSGNGNNFTVGGGTLTNTEDCPNNVFCTWNSLTKGSYIDLNYGNTNVYGNTVTNNGNTWGTISFPPSGKYYWETKVISYHANASSGYPQIGIIRDNTISQGDMNGGTGGYVSSSNDCYYPAGGTTIYSKNGNVTVSATSLNDIIMCAMDSTAGNMKFWMGVNGTWFNSGDPANGTNAIWTETGDYQPVPFMSGYNGSRGDSNFGNGYFGTTAVSSAGTNASGNGIFEYDVPTGYTALSTKGLNL